MIWDLIHWFSFSIFSSSSLWIGIAWFGLLQLVTVHFSSFWWTVMIFSHAYYIIYYIIYYIYYILCVRFLWCLIDFQIRSAQLVIIDFQWTSPLINIDFHFMQLDLAWFILDFINLIFLVFSGHLKGRSYCERAMCVTKITPGLSKWNWNIWDFHHFH